MKWEKKRDFNGNCNVIQRRIATDNAVEFYEWLTKKAKDIKLNILNYVVFRLSNKTYEESDEAAKVVDSKLSKLGKIVFVVLALVMILFLVIWNKT